MEAPKKIGIYCREKFPALIHCFLCGGVSTTIKVKIGKTIISASECFNHKSRLPFYEVDFIWVLDSTFDIIEKQRYEDFSYQQEYEYRGVFFMNNERFFEILSSKSKTEAFGKREFVTFTLKEFESFKVMKKYILEKITQ